MITAPRIHLNGSSKQDLLETNCRARQALHEALAALAQAWPHARDYYPISDHAAFDAMREHRARVNTLGVVLTELEEIAQAISDQK